MCTGLKSTVSTGCFFFYTSGIRAHISSHMSMSGSLSRRGNALLFSVVLTYQQQNTYCLESTNRWRRRQEFVRCKTCLRSFEAARRCFLFLILVNSSLFFSLRSHRNHKHENYLRHKKRKEKKPDFILRQKVLRATGSMRCENLGFCLPHLFRRSSILITLSSTAPHISNSKFLWCTLLLKGKIIFHWSCHVFFWISYLVFNFSRSQDPFWYFCNLQGSMVSTCEIGFNSTRSTIE